MYDIYDSGIPKYSTAQEIYDALCELVQTEEMNILYDLGVTDVSYDGQQYYYTDEGSKLESKFEEIIGWSQENMWKLDMAIFQINHEMDGYYDYYVTDRRNISDIHDIVYEAICNSDLARRLTLKSLFVEHLLFGYDRKYAAIIEALQDELGEKSRFGEYENFASIGKVLDEHGVYSEDIRQRYHNFTSQLFNRAMGLGLEKEKRLIIECRALLTAYDDFILGLRMNQALAEQIGFTDYRNRKLELEAAYEAAFSRLCEYATEIGIDAKAVLGEKPILELAESVAVVIEGE